jgi:anti-anti-sigma factor
MFTTTATTAPIGPDLDAAPAAGVAGAGHRLDMDLESRGRALVVHLRGRLDWITAPALRKRITDGSDWRALVLDLTGLVALDSHGTSSLILAALEARRRHGFLAVAVHDPAITDVLVAIGLGLAVPIVPSVDEAMTLVGSRLSHPSMR